MNFFLKTILTQMIFHSLVMNYSKRYSICLTDKSYLPLTIIIFQRDEEEKKGI